MDTYYSSQPKSSNEIVAEILSPASLKILTTSCGGTRLYIPKNLTAQHKLSTLLGFEQARKLCDIMGGERISISKEHKNILSKRNKEIQADFDSGQFTIFALAQKYDLSERQIFNVLSTTYHHIQ